MTTNPLVTVLLPVYNGEEYISEAVRSISMQTYTDLDILVIDDGSTDGTLKILHRLQEEDPRIRIVTRENRGLIRSLNEGLALVRGTLVARMDADDICYPSRIEKQVLRFAENEKLAICCTHVDYVVSENRVMKFSRPEIASEENAIYNIFDNFFIHSSIMMNKKIFDENNYRYDDAYTYAEDFELFSRISLRHPVDFIKEPLMAVRINHVSTQSLYPQQCMQVYHRVICRNLEMAGVDVDREAVDRLLTPGVQVTADSVNVIRDYLEAAARVREHVVARPETINAAYDVFVSHLFESLALKADPRVLAGAFKSAGVFNRLRLRSKLLVLLTSVLPPSGAVSLRAVAVWANQTIRSRRFRERPAIARG